MCKQKIGRIFRRKCSLFSVAAIIAFATVFAIGAYHVYGFFVKETKCCEKIESLGDDTE